MKNPKSTTQKAEMTDQKKPKGPEPENDTSAKDAKKVDVSVENNAANADGLNKWNDRLDRNMESEEEGDVEADAHAKDYSEKHGSGDQSDED